MSKYGLVGEKLGHSYSKELHEAFGLNGYELIEVPVDKIDGYFAKADFTGINVTIPYKQTAFKYCIADKVALEIGAVNTMVKRNGKVYGYNTDYLGFEYMLKRAGINLAGKKVVILGSGGTSKTARFVCKRAGASAIVVLTRNKVTDEEGGVLFATYEQKELYSDAEAVINTTPVGMYPNINACPIDIGIFDRLEAVADVIYNPSETELLRAAADKGIKHTGGLPMLVAQGWYAERLFTGEFSGTDEIETKQEDSGKAEYSQAQKGIAPKKQEDSGKAECSRSRNGITPKEQEDSGKAEYSQAQKGMVPEIESVIIRLAGENGRLSL